MSANPTEINAGMQQPYLMTAEDVRIFCGNQSERVNLRPYTPNRFPFPVPIRAPGGTCPQNRGWPTGMLLSGPLFPFRGGGARAHTGTGPPPRPTLSVATHATTKRHAMMMLMTKSQPLYMNRSATTLYSTMAGSLAPGPPVVLKLPAGVVPVYVLGHHAWCTFVKLVAEQMGQHPRGVM